MRVGALAIVVLLASGVTARADDEPPPLEQAIQQASRAGKPLLLEFHASWCRPCREFAETTLPDPRVQKALAGVVFVRYDIDAGPGIAAADLYEVQAVPTLLVVDRFGVERLRKKGALLGEAGIAELTDLIAKAREVASDEVAIRKKVKDNPHDIDVKLESASWFVQRGFISDGLAIYDAISTDKHATSAQRLAATSAAAHRRRVDLWKAQLLAEKVALIKAAPADAKEDDVLLAAVNSGITEKERRALLASVMEALIDPPRLDALVQITLAAGDKDLALRQAARLSELRRDTPYVATLAECHYATGDRKGAVALIDEAVGMARGTPQLETVRRLRQLFLDGGNSDSPRVLRLRRKVADLWERMERLDAPANLPDPDALAAATRERENRMQAWKAQFTLARKVATACAPYAGTSELAVARATLDGNGVITSTVLLLEPGVPKDLAPCLDGELKAATIQGMDSKQTLLMINFHH